MVKGGFQKAQNCPPINSSVKGGGQRRSQREGKIKSGPEVSDSEPFFVGCFWKRDSLPEPRPVLCLGAVFARNGSNEISYSM